ncbi:hypothetical protein WOLCODRAFT_135642 [Wolfiporia cocos MD-104 SS10]|uniref:Cora-domain-containing protein n=1 Tax=Wolfiporia cocos (strain MD-104) TaxID=742152 RepID=A0A2H3J3G2_WOLCO|nr:hypothetical protein WOLCODRAFT_135642 [Wolfiporia cocos MD-104 SS10]
MPRENSLSDSEGRSLTPDLEEMMQREAYRSSENPFISLRTTEEFDEQSRPTNLDLRSAPAALNRDAGSPTARSPARPNFDNILRPAYTTPGDRFRTAVRKVMAMNRTATTMMLPRVGVGAEPGIDPRNASASLNYGHIKQRCVIEVVDYSTIRTSFGRMTNHEFIKMLRDPGASRRDSWVRVRWINIGGVSWDVISALALKYDIHPLALEDILSQRHHTRSKVDYYPQHLFLRILCHSLSTEEATSPDVSITDLPRSASPEPIGIDEESDGEDAGYGMGGDHQHMDTDDDDTVYGSASGSRFTAKRESLKRRFTVLGGPPRRRDVENYAMTNQMPQQARFSFNSKSEKKNKVARVMKLLKELKKGDRVNVKIHPMCIFLYRDGTVISINGNNNVNLTAPITERLRQRHTGLRSTADPSLLVQSLLDLMVDSALEVVEEYQGKILQIEQEILLKPSMRTVRRLHILQGDLILHKRTLEPIKTVIYGLRRYDDDRAAALSEKIDPRMKIEGYMSHKAKIYLADVHDHMEYILTSLEMFAGVSENLINYTFNMASYEMNEVMRRLTLATIIFLPLTLLTGYFGMNFQNMWSVDHGHSDVIFWIIALPLMAIVVPTFMWPDLKSMAHYLQKRLVERRLKRTHGRRR